MKDEDVTNEIKSLEKEADQDFDDLFASVGIFLLSEEMENSIFC